MSAINTFALLCIAFIIKHVLADFAFQTQWMTVGKEAQSGWLAPLFAHCACHAGMTGLIAVAVTPCLWWLAVVDFGVHSAIDRGKGLAVRRWALSPSQGKGWWLVFGSDQALHQLVHLGFAYFLAVAVFLS